MYSKKEYQRRILEEQEANGRVFQDFLETFQSTHSASTVKSKTWVKAGSFDAGTGKQDETGKGGLYVPKPFIKDQNDKQMSIKSALECARLINNKKCEKISSKKSTSNLEALKEEIKQRHLERTRVKDVVSVPQPIILQDVLDPNTTNLYMGNINPKLTETDLMEMFGAYGPLASVKIMWPRGEDSANRHSHCGFVAYMSRKDAERAYEAMKKTDIKVSWGKFVEVPQQPIYIPPVLQKLTEPPPVSGLPFNAQPSSASDTDLKNAVVKVSIPTDKKLLATIHRMIEFVIREGPLFEAMIMNREIRNPAYKFLFENTSPSHTYYRWKLYSVMNGESVKTWSAKPFQMFSGGSIWLPPTSLDFSQGMPDHLLEKRIRPKSTKLSDAQCKRLIQFIRDLTMQRMKIGETMVFCLNHGDCSAEIVEYISQSLNNPSTNPLKKLSRLYLISDILSNCIGKKFQHFSFQSDFKQALPDIFAQLHQTLIQLNFSCDREAFKTRVSKVLRQWELLKIYPDDYLNKLEINFLGTPSNTSEISETPLEEECIEDEFVEENSSFNEESSQMHPKITVFVPSRWETLDPEDVEAQAMSSQKFYHMEIQRKTEKEGNATQQISDKKRKRLRNIEMMVMKYQDKLESGRIGLRKDTTIEKELEKYRSNLMKNMDKEESSDSSTENRKCSSSRRKSKKEKSEKRNRKYNRH